MQTCAHVSGAAHFYDPKLIDIDELNADQKYAKKVKIYYATNPIFPNE
jgi:hypothetical protein